MPSPDSLRTWADPRRLAERARAAVGDETLQRNLNYAAEHERGERRAMEARLDWPAMREQARAIRADAVENLDELLDRLEDRVTALGGHVYRAATGGAAARYVADVCAARNAGSVVKGKSMTTEEIELNAELERRGIEVTESDLGEYIVQQRHDHPSHIRAPAIHLNARQVAELFTQLGGKPLPADSPEALLAFARRALREKFLQADVGVTGANFAVADTGTLIVVESEGNIRMATSLPRCHVVVMGIEKVVRDWRGAAHLVQVLPLAAHGQRLTPNVSFITGPARYGDDGPSELHLVLLDNGRRAVARSAYAEALNCIRCGACLAACPVYRQVGGHTYGSSYSGPIGAVITPLLAEDPDAAALADLSSLCGACREACPVDIPLDDQLVMLRRDYRAGSLARGRKGGAKTTERAIFEAWSRLWSHPSGYRATAATGGRALFRLFRSAPGPAGTRAGDAGGVRWIDRAPPPLSHWTANRDLRAQAKEPFHRRWRRSRGGQR